MSDATSPTRQNRAKLSTIFGETKPETTTTVEKTPTGRAERAGQTSMPFWVPLAAKRQLRVMAAEGDTTQQALMREALNLLFVKYGKPPIG